MPENPVKIENSNIIYAGTYKCNPDLIQRLRQANDDLRRSETENCKQ